MQFKTAKYSNLSCLLHIHYAERSDNAEHIVQQGLARYLTIQHQLSVHVKYDANYLSSGPIGI
jgi:hypothetical protein